MTPTILTDSLQFPSGIRAILLRTKSPVIHCGMTVGCGSRNETERQHGTAHLIEHMLFKGTERRRMYHINSLLDNVGGELNAFTTKEETVVHASVLKHDFSKAVDLITDVLFRSTFCQNEIDKEVGVILDEINSYKDSPSELIFDDFEDMIFAGSSLGHNILGDRKHLKKIRRNDILDFIGNNYDTGRMVFAVTGDITPRRFRAVCEKYFSGIAPNHPVRTDASLAPYRPETRNLKKNTYQTHAMIGGRAYSHFDSRRVTLALLVNMLGGSSANTILSLLLREKHGLTYNVEANFSTYNDCGAASVYFSCEEKQSEQCFRLIEGELKKLRTQPLSSLQLGRAKKQFIGQLAIAGENRESYMLSCGRNFMLFNEIDTDKETFDKIMGIRASEVTEVAEEVFAPANLSTLIYH